MCNSLRPRGRVAALAMTKEGMPVQIGAILATGNIAVVEASNSARSVLDELPREIASQILVVDDWRRTSDLRTVLFEGDADALLALDQEVAASDGPILGVQAQSSSDLRRGEDYDLNRLLEECSVSINTTAAGGKC